MKIYAKKIYPQRLKLNFSFAEQSSSVQKQYSSIFDEEDYELITTVLSIYTTEKNQSYSIFHPLLAGLPESYAEVITTVTKTKLLLVVKDIEHIFVNISAQIVP